MLEHPEKSGFWTVCEEVPRVAGCTFPENLPIQKTYVAWGDGRTNSISNYPSFEHLNKILVSHNLQCHKLITYACMESNLTFRL